jgi:hypothetical protein
MKTKTALKAGGNSCKPQPSCHPSSCGGGLDVSVSISVSVGICLGL